MVFIFGVNFPESRLVSKSLQTFYGIGPLVRAQIMAKTHIHATAKIGALTDRQTNALSAELSTMTLENDARRFREEACNGVTGERAEDKNADINGCEAE
ncbi:hypothetical protein LTR09_010176 [Extremus antarcticus]|uniref:30S ribosomal protein S13 n=1 Tax=Extremus antarcticus TaxID=702011 RepID=A0AAJ0GBE3_9PEZI|nr:hypothetical protein LTR09_010176 [Extremus antarcticus]